MTVLKDRVCELRPAFRPVDPVSRTVYEPGEVVQCDVWFPSAGVPLGFGQTGRPLVLVLVLVMVCGYSRWVTALVLSSRSAAGLIAGHWRLLTDLGGVPRSLVWDNEGAVGSWRPGGPRLTEEFAAFAGLLGVKFVLCKPRDPEAKGLVERANGYLETSFLPGGRSPRWPTSTSSWLAGCRRATGGPPESAGQAGRAAGGGPVPDAAAAAGVSAVLVEEPLRLPRDHYVRLDICDYSVHPLAVGRRIEVSADLEQGLAFCDGGRVARHARVMSPVVV
ncbi:Mu transposase domain-containing protein [Streptomyces sp. NPDC052013]|uniref:Mu transposase domain-containing protein n=1 Tax=Streptomyces sp. NPDC052013 TaxID=3365679 RepID=UPI0037CF9E48